MAPDAHKNLAVSAVATAPSPATSGTSLVVTASEGTRFPAAPFNATICPAGVLPDPANAEIVRVTNISTDTLAITRTQEGTSARTVVVGDLIFAAVTAKAFTDIETDLEFAFSTYKPLTDARFFNYLGGTVATTLLMFVGGTVVLAGANSAACRIHLDPADLDAGARAVKLRVRGTLRTNAVDPGTLSFTYGLHRIATWNGASGANPGVATIDAAAGSAVISDPAASSPYTADSADFTLSAAEEFVLAVVSSATTAANSHLSGTIQLFMRQA